MPKFKKACDVCKKDFWELRMYPVKPCDISHELQVCRLCNDNPAVRALTMGVEHYLQIPII